MNLLAKPLALLHRHFSNNIASWEQYCRCGISILIYIVLGFIIHIVLDPSRFPNTTLMQGSNVAQGAFPSALDQDLYTSKFIFSKTCPLYFFFRPTNLLACFRCPFSFSFFLPFPKRTISRVASELPENVLNAESQDLFCHLN